jgi:GNAT superfamily N-acetyltransferase
MHAALALDPSGAVIGFVHWITHPSTWSRHGYCYLEDLFVDPGARGTGAGRALIAHVANWAADAGLEKVYWLTHETNVTARRLYDDIATLSGFVHYERDLGASAVSD